MKIDAHQHFWHYNPAEHVWMTDELAPLKRDFMPSDLAPLLESIQFQGSVAVQARQLVKETAWLLELADLYPTIKGVVGWVDLCSPMVDAQLGRFAAHPKLKGVRHVVHDEPDDYFMLRDDFQRGLSMLRDYKLTYDLLLFPRHLPIAIELLERFPDQSFVIDHIAKPPIRDGRLAPWTDDLRIIAQFPNVFCKLSGMAFESFWKAWTPELFYPYLDVVLAAFGPERLMIGSNWPVETMSGDYQSVMNIVIDYCKRLDTEAQAWILGRTCQQFYHIGAENPT